MVNNPCNTSIWSKKASMLAWCAVSTRCQRALPPSSSAATARVAGVRPPSTTSPPAAVTNRATLKPMPVPPPMSTTVRSANAVPDKNPVTWAKLPDRLSLLECPNCPVLSCARASTV
ncbi:Uncharacterised protein [Mycobacteroides abscessus subsp. abscessus]|nr:Uncharacterised protein [Mycobacteroides abscessus subsp. abscessus]